MFRGSQRQFKFNRFPCSTSRKVPFLCRNRIVIIHIEISLARGIHPLHPCREHVFLSFFRCHGTLQRLVPINFNCISCKTAIIQVVIGFNGTPSLSRTFWILFSQNLMIIAVDNTPTFQRNDIIAETSNRKVMLYILFICILGNARNDKRFIVARIYNVPKKDSVVFIFIKCRSLYPKPVSRFHRPIISILGVFGFKFPIFQCPIIGIEIKRFFLIHLGIRPNVLDHVVARNFFIPGKITFDDIRLGFITGTTTFQNNSFFSQAIRRKHVLIIFGRIRDRFLFLRFCLSVKETRY